MLPVQSENPYRSNTCVIGQHEPTDTVVRLDVGRSACQRNLNGCWSPWNKVGQLPFTDTQERLVDLVMA